MINIMAASYLAILVSSVFMLLTNFLSKKKKEDQEKSSPFECGFNPTKSSRMPFSLRFFLIAIIFLIFDVEITLILPLIFNFNKINLVTWQIVLTAFFLILIMGLIFEWKNGALEWIK